MNLPPCQILAAYLRSKESEGSPWIYWASMMLDAPDTAVGVFDTTGIKDGRSMNSGETFSHPGIQVHVRALDYPTGNDKMSQIQQWLDQLCNTLVTVSGQVYKVMAFSQKGTPQSLGEEPGNRREHFTLNGLIVVEFDHSIPTTTTPAPTTTTTTSA